MAYGGQIYAISRSLQLMSYPDERPPFLEPDIAINTIRSILQQGGRLVVRRHSRNERMPERSVDDLDIRNVLEKNGTISREPKWDDGHQKWKYKVDGYDIDGDELSIWVNIIEENWAVRVITVY